MLNYTTIGSGAPVVFLHGFLESNTMWDYLPELNDLHQIRIELPGHGNSPLLKTEFSIQDIAHQVIHAIDQNGLKEYSIVGHSMGGYVGLEVMKMDKRCNKLILLNSNFWSDSSEKKRDRSRVAKIVEKNKDLFLYEAIPNLFLNPELNDSEVKSLIEEARKMDAQAIASSSIAMSKRIDNTEFVQKNELRILVLQGAQDTIVSAQQMINATTGAGVSFSLLKDCGHMGHIEKPIEVADHIFDFIGTKKTETF